MIWFAVAGFVFGIIGGMGMGGGIILIPVLTLFLGVNQHAAQGLNLLAFLPMAGFALAAHIKKKRVDFKLAIFLCISGLAGALLGAWVVGSMENDLLRKLFGGFLILLGGACAGGLVGALLLDKLKGEWVNAIFTLLIIASGIRMVF